MTRRGKLRFFALAHVLFRKTGIHPRLRGGELFSGTCAGAILIACLGLLDLAHLAQAQQAQSIFIEGDMVRGNTPKGQTGPTCVLNNQFKHNWSLQKTALRSKENFGKV
jgi:hypothetical protein